ncbi:GNAT family N-acetyltransferase [Agrobacterium tumefaciens]|uniref:GNAT family N-acetyltransferase n=1 Tax=Agrobacterium tumefaciens TaxID=358 RepID=UPI0009B7E88B|nr:GNAT family N-acetyltransferase [Agrobacterium tumefaciens]
MSQLKSSRLVLRPFRMTDSSPLARLTNDPLILRNLLRTAYPFETDDARRLIRRIAERRLPVWAVDDGRLVGLIGLSGEFGLWLDRRVWGKGYGEEAGRLVIDYAFQHLGIRTLRANPLFDNRASHRLMDKLGFVATGRANAFCRQRGKIVPLRPYRLERG